jgi:hypothetical protein
MAKKHRPFSDTWLPVKIYVNLPKRGPPPLPHAMPPHPPYMQPPPPPPYPPLDSLVQIAGLLEKIAKSFNDKPTPTMSFNGAPPLSHSCCSQLLSSCIQARNERRAVPLFCRLLGAHGRAMCAPQTTGCPVTTQTLSHWTPDPLQLHPNTHTTNHLVRLVSTRCAGWRLSRPRGGGGGWVGAGGSAHRCDATGRAAVAGGRAVGASGREL